MPTITFNDFRGGLDVRRSPSVSDANKLVKLENAYVTHGYTIKKRPGLKLFATLTDGSYGLVGAGGKMHTFSASAIAAHSETIIENHVAAHESSLAVTGASAADMFNGYLYAAVQYANGSTRHHYFDDPGAWSGSTAYAMGVFRRPVATNGFRYEVTTAGTTAATEPAWPTTPGATVADGTVTWTCRSYAVTDINCPHDPSMVRAGSKIFSVKNDVVRFSATNAARDWTTANDAGFLPVGLQSAGDTTPTALGQFEIYLAVFFEDAMQTWLIGADPSTHALYKNVNIGTQYKRAHGNLANDVFFLTQSGFRSLSTANSAGTIQDLDVGSPIDALLKTEMKSAINPLTIFWRGGGMMMCFIGSNAYVYSISRAAKVSAWSVWKFGIPVDAVTEANGVLYLRSGNSVYKLDDEHYLDNTSFIEVSVELPFMDCKRPGVVKQFYGCDAVITGTAQLAHRYDPSQPTLITPYVDIEGDTRPGGMIPVELATTNIAPVIRHAADEAFELAAISYQFENLMEWQ